MNPSSDYEKQRLENIKRNAEFLRAIGIDNVKPREVQTFRNPTKSTRKRPAETTTSVNTTNLRRSKRLSGESSQIETEDTDKAQWEQVLTPSLGGVAALLRSSNIAARCSTFTDDSCAISSLRINEYGVQKLVKSRVTALSMHPTSDRVIVFAGDKDGTIGVWNASSQSDQVCSLFISPIEL